MQLWSKKAMTVFYTKLLLWFKPFHGFFHLKALVGVWCACGVISELVNCCPLAARTRRCVSAVTITAVSFFVLWLDVHETFCSTSSCVHLPLRHPSTNQAQDFRTPVKFLEQEVLSQVFEDKVTQNQNGLSHCNTQLGVHVRSFSWISRSMHFKHIVHKKRKTLAVKLEDDYLQVLQFYLVYQTTRLGFYLIISQKFPAYIFLLIMSWFFSKCNFFSMVVYAELDLCC